MAAFYLQTLHLLRKQGYLLFMIHTSSPEQAREYLRRFSRAAPYPGTLLLDQTRSTHQAVGLGRSVYRSLVPAIWQGLMTRPWRQLGRSVSLGASNADIVGDSWQQGGTLVLDKVTTKGSGGSSGVRRVKWLHREHVPGDRVDIWKFCREALSVTNQGDLPRSIAAENAAKEAGASATTTTTTTTTTTSSPDAKDGAAAAAVEVKPLEWSECLDKFLLAVKLNQVPEDWERGFPATWREEYRRLYGDPLLKDEVGQERGGGEEDMGC